jgi:outer membrane protein
MRKPLALALLCACIASGQAKPLTRSEAEQLALRNHPRIESANLLSGAAKSVVTEARSGLYPQISGSLTGVGAEHSSTLAAGTLQTSSLYSRVAAGVTVSQLVTDFGRTKNLTESAKSKALAQNQIVGNTRAQILIEVDQAYYQQLAADSVLNVAKAVLENRRVTLRQVTALAQSSLKSTLDVSFAQIAVSEAELALFRAENDVQSAQVRLSAALGSEQMEHFDVLDEPLPSPLDAEPDNMVSLAQKQRPDLAALQFTRDAAARLAKAEGRLSYPTVSLLGAAGGLPDTDPRLHGTYSAAGVNVNIPVFNGHLYSARQTEAELRAKAADKDVEALSIQVSEQVRLAWIEATNAFRRLDVTARLVQQAVQTLRLAQARYDIGLGSIVELNQAQLSQVSAEIAAATAKYEYLSRRAVLDFVTGALR